MWKERADYGHFFYRILNGESAADAYDRISGFNESLWRQFGEQEFPSVLVLVTHGLMSRVFLMKWYHWSVEYFEDLRNVNHCEFVVMKMNSDSGKYVLETPLRTWSELKRQRAEQAQAGRNPSRRNTLSAFLQQPQQQEKKSPSIPARKWGGCIDGCNHHNERFPRRAEQELPLPPAADSNQPDKNENDDHALAHQEPATPATANAAADSSNLHKPPASSIPSYLGHSREPSGSATPHEMPSDDDDEEGEHTSYFPNTASTSTNLPSGSRSIATAMRKRPERKPTPEDIERWTNESGMGRGKQADALGDEPAPEEEEAPDQDGAQNVREAMEERLEKEEKEDRSLRGSVY